MLHNLGELAERAQNNYRNNFLNEDFKLNREFKERFTAVAASRGAQVQFFEYSAEIATSSNNKVFCPNQWFYLATFVVEFVSELYKYKNIVEEIAESQTAGITRRAFMEKVNRLNQQDDPESYAPEIKEAIENHFSGEPLYAEYLWRFLTDYSWWSGKKTIDRQDFYVSPTLKLLELVAVSQGYVADIVNFLVSDESLKESSLNLREDNINRVSGSIKGKNLIVYGAPGTGKSRYLEDNYSNTTRVVFHSEYSYYDFVGSYKPVPVYMETNEVIRELNGDPFNTGKPMIDYRFVPGPFVKVLIDAIMNTDKEFTLLLEELNRANAPAVFGDIFQLLDRDSNGKSQYTIMPDKDLYNYLSSLRGVGHLFTDGIYIPSNMNIVSTMNSADQGVYVLDSAFKRRWMFKYMPILDIGFSHENKMISYGGEAFKWRILLSSINSKLKKLGINEDRLIGQYFITPDEIENQENIFAKLLIYLWDDVVRYKRKDFFDPTIQTYSELVTAFQSGEDVMKIMSDLSEFIRAEEEEVERESQLGEEEVEQPEDETN